MHPETELIPYLHGELSAADHDRVAAHVAGCAECRQATEESRAVLQALAARQAGPPPLDWGRYQAEVRERAAGRSQRRWWTRPVPRLEGLSSDERAFVERNPERWRRMSPEERQRALDRYRYWHSMPPEQRRAVRENVQHFRALPFSERQRILEDFQRWN